MSKRNFAQIAVPRPLSLRLRGVLLVLRGKDVLFDQGAHFEEDGQPFTLAKLAVAQWIATDDPLKAHRKLALEAERVFGRAEWDEPLEREVAGRRSDE